MSSHRPHPHPNMPPHTAIHTSQLPNAATQHQPAAQYDPRASVKHHPHDQPVASSSFGDFPANHGMPLTMSQPYPIRTNLAPLAYNTLSAATISSSDNTQCTVVDSPTSLEGSAEPSSAEPSSSKLRVSRRQKPRIKLADDQPPTTQGNPRARVYLACVQCRTRKIRCDGNKPVCYNCNRRPAANSGSDPCSYDAIPKRRGPDKAPGARQRMARELRNQLEAQPRRRRRRKDDSTTTTTPGHKLSLPPLPSMSLPPSAVPQQADSPSIRHQASLQDEIIHTQIYPDLASTNSSAAPSQRPSAAAISQTCLSTDHLLDQDLVESSTLISSIRRSSYSTSRYAPQSLPSAVSDSGPNFTASNRSDTTSSQSPPPQSQVAPIPPYLSPDLRAASRTITEALSGRITQRPYDEPPIPSFDAHPIHMTTIDEPLSYGYITEVDENSQDSNDGRSSLQSQPSIDFSRQIWWDSLLSLYHSPYSRHLVSLTSDQRTSTVRLITEDLKFAFKASNYWFSFFHVPSFFTNYYHSRHVLQPSLVLALLAISIQFQSSERERGAAGRHLSNLFRDHAQAALEASLNSGWIDETLAQAAWVLAMYEICAHDQHSTARSISSLVYLDSIIRSLQLTYVDANSPGAATFQPNAVPCITEESAHDSWANVPARNNYSSPDSAMHSIQSRPGTSLSHGCSCKALTLGNNWGQASQLTPLWVATPAWNSNSEGEIRRESIRRLCWTAMTMAAGHLSYGLSMDLFIANPANYALLFSAESLSPNTPLHSSKYTVWALYEQIFLLWHGCVRMRHDPLKTTEEKVRFGMQAWVVADKIEEALKNHTCDLERAFVYHGREFLFNIRMCISFEYRRYIPVVSPDIHRLKAMEWLSYQRIVGSHFINLGSLVGNEGATLARRPFFIFWFMGQITRALTIWKYDQSLTLALEVCKSLIPPTDYLEGLWPCADQRRQMAPIRKALYDACIAAGIPPPPPPARFTYPPL